MAIFLCYLKIFIFTYKSRNKSKSSSATKSIRLAKGLFASFMLFTVCWMPYGLIVMIDFQDKLPRSVIMFTMTLGHYNSSLNPFLYAMFNSAFRRGCINLFKKLGCGSICTFGINRVNTTERQSASNSTTKNQNRTMNLTKY